MDVVSQPLTPAFVSKNSVPQVLVVGTLTLSSCLELLLDAQ